MGSARFAATSSLLAEIAPAYVNFWFVEVDSASLAAAGVTLRMMLDDPYDVVISSRPGRHARAAGLVTRPSGQTAVATRKWDEEERGRPALTKGPTRDQEADLVRDRGK
jgi:hypothetical protein